MHCSSYEAERHRRNPKEKNSFNGGSEITEWHWRTRLPLSVKKDLDFPLSNVVSPKSLWYWKTLKSLKSTYVKPHKIDIKYS